MQPQLNNWILSDINVSSNQREKIIRLWDILENEIHKEIARKGYASIERLDWSTIVAATFLDVSLKTAFVVLEKVISVYSSMEGWKVERYDYGGFTVPPGKIIPPVRRGCGDSE